MTNILHHRKNKIREITEWELYRNIIRIIRCSYYVLQTKCLEFSPRKPLGKYIPKYLNISWNISRNIWITELHMKGTFDLRDQQGVIKNKHNTVKQVFLPSQELQVTKGAAFFVGCIPEGGEEHDSLLRIHSRNNPYSLSAR